MNLMSFKSDQKVTRRTMTNQNYRPSRKNPLTVKDFLSAKASSAGRAEAVERGERTWLGTAKKI